MTDAAWQRLGKTVEKRIRTLGLDFVDVARRSPMSIETLAKIRRGERVSAKMLRRLEHGLSWQTGSADAVLDGGDPVEEPAVDDEALRGAPDAAPPKPARPTLRELSEDPRHIEGLTWVARPDDPGLLFYTLRRRRHGRLWTTYSTLPATASLAEAWDLLCRQQDEQLEAFEERLRAAGGADSA